MPRVESTLTIQNRIQEKRMARGFTQEQLAEEIGVTRATIIAIEKGNYNPSLELAFRLAKVFKTGVETLFFEKGDRRD